MRTTLRSETNVQAFRTATLVPVTGGPAGLMLGANDTDGVVFTMQFARLGAVFAARNNPVSPGYIEIGRK
ncbi:hypothetical protein [Ramlibacter alkalitolerans]|uniref:Uncharacterized protein n=1 Tax=Ramlibacter alkalitolerans TaxID=2039631 RepID=A0ABS1JTL9_9BURK|nr:hypothetical protein [Ramlibacter alkalitolerans]MBL0427557.1 hypothetical protein [Ramlibacter alkalitolerans]